MFWNGWKDKPMKTKAQESWRTRPLPPHAQTEWNQATQAGPLWDRYCIYVDAMEDCGAPDIRTFDEWLAL